MSYDEPLVGSLAIIFAIVAVTVALGPWHGPYRLRSFSAVVRRFGKPAARGLWMAIAIALMSAGIAIISGFRPSYATPTQQSSLER